MLFDAKDMRMLLKFHIYSISNVRFKWFRFQVRHFDFQLNSHRICTGRCSYQQRWLRHSQKQMKHCWICLRRWLTSFDSIVTKFITFSPKNHPHNLHFRWRNSITGWIISKISTSFHHALMAIRIRWRAMEMSAGNWDIQEQRWACATLHPPLFEG